MTVEVQTLTATIAAELGDGWYASPGYHVANNDAFLHRADGASIHVTADGFRASERGRLFLAGVIPTGYARGRRVEISVSQSKTAAQIARDVALRLLPSYLPKLAAAVDEKWRDEQAAEAREQLLDELAGVLGARRNPYDDGLRFGAFREGVSGSVSVTRGDSSYARFEVEVPAQQAAELAAYITKLGQPEFDANNECRACGAHIAEPCSPECPVGGDA